MLIAGRAYGSVPQGYTADVDGDVRPVYSTACPADGSARVTVPQDVSATISSDTRPVYAEADCEDGSSLAGTAVRAYPQGISVDIDGDTRPVYSFACCPGGSSSSGGVPIACCAGLSLPLVIYATFSSGTSDCACLDGTYPLTWTSNQFWEYNAPGPCGGLEIHMVFNGALVGSLSCTFAFWCGSTAGSTLTGTVTCSPFSIVYGYAAGLGNAEGCCFSGTGIITLTE